jgi:hypothetical protein
MYGAPTVHVRLSKGDRLISPLAQAIVDLSQADMAEAGEKK